MGASQNWLLVMQYRSRRSASLAVMVQGVSDIIYVLFLLANVARGGQKTIYCRYTSFHCI